MDFTISNAILTVNKIAFNYPHSTQFKGISNVSLQAEPGKILAIIGKSGSGKTTLLKCIYGLEDLQEGKITIGNKLVLGPAYNLIPGHSDMRFVSQDFYVLDNHTVEENIKDKLMGYTDEYKHKRSNQLLRLLDLTSFRNLKAITLSSGQKQRVAIARSLAEFPKVLLLDEPFSNLDLPLRDKIFTYIRQQIKKENSAVILVTHQPEEALRYADETAVMENGKLIQHDKTFHVYYHPKTKNVAALMGRYFILDQNDLISTKIKVLRNQTYIRPNQLQIVDNKTHAQLQVTVTNVFFNGYGFEYFAETKQGNSVYFYSKDNSIQIDDAVYLKVNWY
ncbi:MAG: transporter ATP-binding protein [Bacteroidota bacterium]|jgi:ABC-type Fe3+/spermidine/putrescine transport system ATPase subunit|nr:transporter ATP-binding protein [Bacteroidota bacterium]